MEDIQTAYCRFCAQQSNSDKMLNVFQDNNKFDDINMKLIFFNADYVDLISESPLPKTICFVCLEELNKSYEFFCNIKKAQTFLNDIFPLIEQFSDDDKNFDDCVDESELKEDIPILATNNMMEVKVEPKEEEVDEKVDFDDIFETALRCSPVYEDKEGVKKSISKWKDYPWICAFCNIEFLDIETLRLHSRLTHGRCNAFSCVFCKNFECVYFIDFVNHVRKHKRKLRKRCEYCDAMVKSDELKKHATEHLKDEIPCHYCGEVFSKVKLQEHLEEFEPIKPKRKRHKKRGVPITIDDLTCKLCNKIYKSLNSLRDHQKLHSKDRKKEYTCERCGKMFYNKGTLTSHIMAHDKVRPHITPEGVFPINPQTGELVQVIDAGTEEWKSKIMVPGKRGRKSMKKNV
ncbi:unnamed protein product [Leptidea sinapis]|uniref:Protein krueppel n=1 Tax=Leptidea sinapis TaxID=189913 RepID=A0A5E4PVY8_9NEOP|nr:unnamed protein product [Leptidea sinapis]